LACPVEFFERLVVGCRSSHDSIRGYRTHKTQRFR
jgi:hypothetical protein